MAKHFPVVSKKHFLTKNILRTFGFFFTAPPRGEKFCGGSKELYFAVPRAKFDFENVRNLLNRIETLKKAKNARFEPENASFWAKVFGSFFVIRCDDNMADI